MGWSCQRLNKCMPVGCYLTLEGPGLCWSRRTDLCRKQKAVGLWSVPASCKQQSWCSCGPPDRSGGHAGHTCCWNTGFHDKRWVLICVVNPVLSGLGGRGWWQRRKDVHKSLYNHPWLILMAITIIPVDLCAQLHVMCVLSDNFGTRWLDDLGFTYCYQFVRWDGPPAHAFSMQWCFPPLLHLLLQWIGMLSKIGIVEDQLPGHTIQCCETTNFRMWLIFVICSFPDS